MFSEACRQFTRNTLFAISGTHAQVCDWQVRRDVISQLRRRRRGCWAGDHHRPAVSSLPSTLTSAVSAPSRAGEIPIIIGKLMLSDVNNDQPTIHDHHGGHYMLLTQFNFVLTRRYDLVCSTLVRFMRNHRQYRGGSATWSSASPLSSRHDITTT